MKTRNKIGFSLLLIGFFILTAFKGDDKQGKWIQLFNGKDLDNWTVKIKGFEAGEDFKNTFRVEDGLLKVSYDQYDRFDNYFGHLFYNKPFANYRLRVEYRFFGQHMADAPEWTYLNNGVMIFGQSPESMEIDQNFPTSIEVQLLGSDGTYNPSNLNVCTPGTNIVLSGELTREHCISSGSKTCPQGEWIVAEIEVRSDTIKHFLNGELVLQYSQPQLDEQDETYAKLLPPNGDKILHGGTISIQSEGHPIEFRKIDLQVLED
ncbi:3-keto-disaccharide hydrolase [Mangrovibacterium lignilyticum]|uniref:3-keto-disaccharide hydrolase n=1 Tax=Mangrovibacterium lignilyticum TaxID=2668052 RepID=UPI0013D53C78|nr:DUF1080 domain-containing protein [Mangrovibacterium lignilyticum]